jgi:hypothetical protein
MFWEEVQHLVRHESGFNEYKKKATEGVSTPVPYKGIDGDAFQSPKDAKELVKLIEQRRKRHETSSQSRS